jgi:MFS family permease
MAQQTAKEPTPRKIWGMHPNVFFLGLVSFLTDVSSELIFTLVPLVVVNILGGGAISVGLIGGVTESFDAFFRIFSGRISDRLGKRKGLAILGYGFSTIVKPFMLLSATWGSVLAVRFGDRFGKGIRSSPRDALIADSVSLETRGRGFGIHKTMDTAGAFMGLVISAIIIYAVQGGGELTRESYRWMVIIGIIPAVLAVIILIACVKEMGPGKKAAPASGVIAAVKTPFDRRFKLFMVVMAIFTLGNSSDFFVILRAENLGVSAFNIALMLVLFNLTYFAVAAPAGILSDKLGRRKVIGLGWAVYALCYLGFALSTSAWHMWLLFAAYGIYYGVVEGATKAFVADLVPQTRRGTAYGYYNGLVGLMLLPASVLAGWLWEAVSPALPFYLGAGFAALAMVGMMVLVKDETLNPKL